MDAGRIEGFPAASEPQKPVKVYPRLHLDEEVLGEAFGKITGGKRVCLEIEVEVEGFHMPDEWDKKNGRSGTVTLKVLDVKVENEEEGGRG